MIVNDDPGLNSKGLDALLGLIGARNGFLEPKFSAQCLTDQFSDALCAPPFILFLCELALNQNGVECHSVGRREDLGARRCWRLLLRRHL